ncbi:MAG: polysaccharide pyruvyl transferase family protein [Chitinophagaceae bacterium]|nr:polysaccharide pyruvyl transferase family protein [Chitinophagaceae bacterium]
MQENARYIVLIDPALQDNDGTDSWNIGDMIISESIMDILRSMFPGKEIVRISSHVVVGTKHRKIIKEAFLTFIGGSNLITSSILGYRSFPIRDGRLVWLFPGIQNMILFGPGWGDGYGKPLNLRTKIFYKRILHPAFLHSLRDQYSADKLMKETGINTINTTCPTLWHVSEVSLKRSSPAPYCLFTLTDYDIDPERDQLLLKMALENFEKIVFFPQGRDDINYLSSLPVFQNNKTKIALLPHSYKEFRNLVSTTDITYMGTRLHSGIKCLQHNRDVMIVATDQRAINISKDTHIPVCERGNLTAISRWLNGNDIFDKEFSLPKEGIIKWENQFL